MQNQRSGLSVYKAVDLQSKVGSASPHQLISMLYDGLDAQLKLALAASASKNIESKDIALKKCVDIIDGLRDSLSINVESNLPYDLDRLYDYMQRRLLSARISKVHQETEESNSATFSGAKEKIEEVLSLLDPIRSGWKDISPDMQKNSE